MKLIHKLGKNNQYFTAIVVTDKRKPLYDFDPVKVRLALTIADPHDVADLIDALDLTYPVELLHVSHEWELEI